MQSQIICDEHNLPIISIDQDNLSKFCQICIQQKYFIGQQNEQTERKIRKHFQELIDEKILKLSSLKEKLNDQLLNTQLLIFKILDQLEHHISFLKQSTQKQIEFNTQDQINQICNNIENQSKSVKADLINQLEKLSQIIQVNALFESLSEFSPQTNLQQFLQQEHQIPPKKKIQLNKYKYELQKNFSQQQKRQCYAMDINLDATMLIVGCEEIINVFDISQNTLKETQQLTEHKNMKSDHFISTGRDLIIFWIKQNNQQWVCLQQLRSHKKFIQCITMNEKENLLISGSHDNTISFQEKLDNNTWIQKQQINCSSNIISLSLNESNQKLIASVVNKQILVIEQKDKEWILIQNIVVDQYGLRIGFVGNNYFVLQPFEKSHLEIYKYDLNEEQFIKDGQIIYQERQLDTCCLFPIKFIKNRNLLLIKNGEYLNLIRRIDDGEFVIDQSISFGTSSLYGCISDDGGYIITWDSKSKEIQVRKLVES